MKSFFLAARPKTLIVGIAPTLACYFYAKTLTENVSGLLLFCALVSAIMIQIATNFFNDVIDHEKGADKQRLGPMRVTAAGKVPPQTVKKWAFACLGVALVTAIPLIMAGGPVILVLGLISLYLSYGYTGGIVSLAYRGLGELFVFLFFGLFAFLGSQYIFIKTLNLTGFYFATQFGLLAVTFIAVNNLRDRSTDLAVNKRTLATRMSPALYRLLIAATILLPYFLNLLQAQRLTLLWMGLLIALPLTVFIYRKDGRDLNPGLALAGAHLMIFTILTIKGLSGGNLL